MTDQAAATRRDDEPASGRSVTRRRSLPGGRAVVGAFLVALAAVGIFTAYLRSNAVPTTEYVVAARDLLPGDVLTSQDLRLVAIQLPDAQVATTASNRDAMVDRVVLSPVTEGELFGVGDTADAAEVAGTSAVTVPLDTNRALAGDLEPGDRVDVIATHDDVTRYVAGDLAVVRATVDGTATAVTLAAPDAATVLAVTNAIDTAEVFLARANPDVVIEDTSEVTAGSTTVTPPGASTDHTPDPGPTAATQITDADEATQAATPGGTQSPNAPQTPEPIATPDGNAGNGDAGNGDG